METLRNVNQNPIRMEGNSDASQQSPIVSIGVPVYNSEKYLEETLQSLLAQGFQDFEIIISDNGSTDSTQEICLAYAERDDRIRYHRSETSYGPGWNYNHVFDLAKGTYFKWQAHDDLLAPDFLEKCVAVLEQQPDVVLCHCYSSQIDDQGITLASNLKHLHTDHLHSSVRLRSLLMQGQYVGCEIFGLMRMSTLQQVPRQGSYAHADFLFICNLALHGRFCQVPELLFHFRIHPAQSMQTRPAQFRQRRRLLPFTGPIPSTSWWNPQKKSNVDFPTWRFYRLQIRFISKQSLSTTERVRCYQALLERLFLGKDSFRLGIDVLLALETALLEISETLVTRNRDSRSPLPKAPS